MFRTARDYVFEEMGIKIPKGEIDGFWFAVNQLPMVVNCACCGKTMPMPTAMVDDDGSTYCHKCAK
ncbi:MAG: hypothetical protein IJZ62_04100 [Clostridia bacterium]|nr:hypothetical protein [Clostridia bacterium]